MRLNEDDIDYMWYTASANCYKMAMSGEIQILLVMKV